MSDLIQGSEEWVQYRLGKISASRLHEILAKTKSGPSASRKNYMAQLVAETLTGRPGEHFTSRPVEWGTENEPIARMRYEAENLVSVEQKGFIDHPTIPNCGASPDGLVGLHGGLEIKCPNTATHLETLMGSSLKTEYFAQVQWNMECSGRDWWDFVSFDPVMPENLAYFCKRIERDEKFLVEARAEVIKFQDEMHEILAKLRAL